MTLKEALDMVTDARESYADYAAEARACGYEVEPFDVWAGKTDPKEEALARWQERAENDTWDLY